MDALVTPEFRHEADSLFGFQGTEKQARTTTGWLTAERTDEFLSFCRVVAAAYKSALTSGA